MTRARAALLVALAAAPGCRRPRDPRAIERLVPVAASAPADAAPSSDAAPPEPVARQITDRPAPAGVFGTRWGMTRAELEAAHREANVACRGADEFLFCRRPLVPVATDAVAGYELCDGRLCGVALDGVRTRDEDRLAQDFARLLEAARRELGPPLTEVRHVAPGCRGHLALCLGARQSQLMARWHWPGGAQVVLAAEPTEEDALTAQVSLTCLSAARAARPEPPAPAPDGGGDAAAP